MRPGLASGVIGEYADSTSLSTGDFVHRSITNLSVRDPCNAVVDVGTLQMAL